MSHNKNTPQNVNKSPDKKNGNKGIPKSNSKTASDKKNKPSGQEGTGIGGSQLGTQEKVPQKESKGTSREVRDLG